MTKFQINDEVVRAGWVAKVVAIHITGAEVRYDLVRAPGDELTGVLEGELVLSETEALRREVNALRAEVAALRMKTAPRPQWFDQMDPMRRLGEPRLQDPAAQRYANLDPRLLRQDIDRRILGEPGPQLGAMCAQKVG